MADTVPVKENAAPPGYTILRIKRRRDEEPLDALGAYSVLA